MTLIWILHLDLRISCDIMLNGLCRKLRLYGVDCVTPEQSEKFLVRIPPNFTFLAIKLPFKFLLDSSYNYISKICLFVSCFACIRGIAPIVGLMG